MLTAMVESATTLMVIKGFSNDQGCRYMILQCFLPDSEKVGSANRLTYWIEKVGAHSLSKGNLYSKKYLNQ